MMTGLVGISGWGLILLTPGGLYLILHQRCHRAHTFNLLKPEGIKRKQKEAQIYYVQMITP